MQPIHYICNKILLFLRRWNSTSHLAWRVQRSSAICVMADWRDCESAHTRIRHKHNIPFRIFTIQVFPIKDTGADDNIVRAWHGYEEPHLRASYTRDYGPERPFAPKHTWCMVCQTHNIRRTGYHAPKSGWGALTTFQLFYQVGLVGHLFLYHYSRTPPYLRCGHRRQRCCIHVTPSL